MSCKFWRDSERVVPLALEADNCCTRQSTERERDRERERRHSHTHTHTHTERERAASVPSAASCYDAGRLPWLRVRWAKTGGVFDQRRKSSRACQ